MPIGRRAPARPKPSGDDFVVREGLQLLAGFRRIRSDAARRAIVRLVASVVAAEGSG